MYTYLSTISPDDIIFVTVSSIGRRVASFTLSGMNSDQDIDTALRHNLADMGGLLTVDLRNRTSGTSARRVLRMRPSRPQMQWHAA